ncbi:hypothetical protein ABIB25_002988 [Nakamurella sp. UYEF19]|uniref:hypothetical protein n=1 Tax=Nakamurella sp. UYEF19 TaxID=1756392 RepID=UPI0033988CBB
MNRRQILLATRIVEGHTDELIPAVHQADLVHLSKLLLHAQHLRWRRSSVVREIARVEAHVINHLRDEGQERPMARRRQRGLFGKRRQA